MALVHKVTPPTRGHKKGAAARRIAARATAQGDPIAPAAVRLDAELVRRGLARSRDDAAELVAAGAVSVDGVVAAKPAMRVSASVALETRRSTPEYVSRGAHKLAGALADLSSRGLSATSRRCMDVGASTGGFTQVLLAAGAAAVVAVDVGTDQLAPLVRGDPRVQVHDGVNARQLDPVAVGLAELVVVDLSFISLRLVLPALVRCVAPAGDLLVMVKPQFEVGGGGGLDARGVVRDPALRLEAVSAVAIVAYELGLGTRAAVASRSPGPAGNVEYFLWLRRDAPPPMQSALRAAVDEGPR